ncbi:hypothetical protein IFM89_021842 [Coptis chinensis]|uniref:Uncharacterized protein n=1 Tax=Coptis chinensis TaxID=261450 RepID=A0A835I460_9MAGN|nr:hypothetical protein IFM89_021842 [Coptis chinensis]
MFTGIKVVDFDGSEIRLSLETFIPTLDDFFSQQKMTIEEGGAMLGSGNILDIQIILASGIPLLEKSADQKFSNRPEYVFYKRTTRYRKDQRQASKELKMG